MENTYFANNKSNAGAAKLSYCLPSRIMSAVFKQFTMCHHFNPSKQEKLGNNFNVFLNAAVELFLFGIG